MMANKSVITSLIDDNARRFHELELQKKEQLFAQKIVILFILGLLAIIGLVGYMVSISKDVSYETEFDCTTGDVDFSFDNSTNIFNISGVDGLRCKVFVKGAMPVSMAQRILYNLGD